MPIPAGSLRSFLVVTKEVDRSVLLRRGQKLKVVQKAQSSEDSYEGEGVRLSAVFKIRDGL